MSYAHPPPTRQHITGLILAGGAGQRLHGVDKGLQLFNDKPLVAWLLDALVPQCAQVRISANRNLSEYQRYGYPVSRDHAQLPQFSGPLAGIARALADINTPWLSTVPCDTPLLPADLVARLAAAVTTEHADIAIIVTGDQWQPLHALIARHLAADLDAYLASGQRQVRGWLQRHRLALVASDDTAAFCNLNYAADFTQHAASVPPPC